MFNYNRILPSNQSQKLDSNDIKEKSNASDNSKPIDSELESKSTFIRTISHEIRSPLSTVNLGIEMLIENISKHLDFADDKNKLNLKDLDETLSDIKISVDSVRPFKVQANAAKVGIEYNNLNGEVLNYSISVDVVRMEQVLRNFFSNAIKFSPANSKIFITVSLLKSFSKSIIDGVEKIPGPKGVVRISVIDQGAGISKDNQKKLFGQYVQIDSNKLQNGKGSGLGLWLSKTIVDLHGGVIGVESQGEGKGSTFFVELPLYEPIQNSTNRLPNVMEITAARKIAHAKTPTANPRKFPNLSISIQSPNNANVSNEAFLYSQYAHAINAVSKGSLSRSDSVHDMHLPNKQSFKLDTPRSSPTIDTSIESGIGLQAKNLVCNWKSPKLNIISALDEDDEKVIEEVPEIKKLNILIVDDALIGRKMVQKVLSGIYNVCSQAKDGLEAYNIIRSNLVFYDVVLMDCYMPKMNGPESTKLMREAGFIGVILGCTGSSTSEDEDAFMKSGADGVLVKPLS
eukprot:gene19615-25524_t